MPITLKTIYRYPVKSMGGHKLPNTRLAEQGIPGDRCWALKDEERGGIKGGKRFASLMSMSAQLHDEPDSQNLSPVATITLPNGTKVTTADSDINGRLSEAVGAPVSIWPILPKEQLDHYRRMPPDPNVDQEAAMREVFARTQDEPLPDLSSFPAELFSYESPPGTYFDAYPLLILSTSALEAMQSQYAESNFDVRRFRPNLVIEGTPAGFAEDLWVGKTAQLGSAVVKFEMACPRCVMTTHGFDDLPKDPKIMRALVKANGGNLGIYANIEKPGTIAVGDTLDFLN